MRTPKIEISLEKLLAVHAARKAVDIFRDTARAYAPLDFRRRDELVMAIHKALDMVEK